MVGFSKVTSRESLRKQLAEGEKFQIVRMNAEQYFSSTLPPGAGKKILLPLMRLVMMSNRVVQVENEKSLYFTLFAELAYPVLLAGAVLSTPFLNLFGEDNSVDTEEDADDKEEDDGDDDSEEEDRAATKRSRLSSPQSSARIDATTPDASPASIQQTISPSSVPKIVHEQNITVKDGLKGPVEFAVLEENTKKVLLLVEVKKDVPTDIFGLHLDFFPGFWQLLAELYGVLNAKDRESSSDIDDVHGVLTDSVKWFFVWLKKDGKKYTYYISPCQDITSEGANTILSELLVIMTSSHTVANLNDQVIESKLNSLNAELDGEADALVAGAYNTIETERHLRHEAEERERHERQLRHEAEERERRAEERERHERQLREEAEDREQLLRKELDRLQHAT